MAAVRIQSLAVVWALLAAATGTAEVEYASHPPMRALPTATSDAIPAGPAYHVDPTKGEDAADGSPAKPWKTIGRGVRDLKPGDVLLLHGGVYHERITLATTGTKDKPIIIRSFPNELAVIDGGLAEFRESPAKAWEPIPDGAGEYRSTGTYPGLAPMIHGHFLDSMIPLHGYRHRTDMTSDNGYWTVKNKLDAVEPFYCGPGLWFDEKTKRIHVRLAHTTVKQIGGDNYRGETDPRKLPLVVAGTGVPLSIKGAKHLRLNGIVVRGGSRATVEIEKSEGIELDRLAVFGASPAMQLTEVSGLKVSRSAVRGISAPWSSRAGHKYRGASAYLIVAKATTPPSQDVEFDRCELTDSHDGPYIGTIKGLKIHQCLVDNFNDDGIYLTAAGVGGPVEIYQNVISRCLHCFAFAGKYEVGAGVSVYRNVFDLRRGVPYFWPNGPDDPEFKGAKSGDADRFPWGGRLAGDHGSPTWEPMRFYQNTVVYRTPAFRQLYGCGLGGHIGAKRAVLNNIFVEMEGMPGLEVGATDDILFQGDGNLHWNPTAGPAVKGDWFAKFRTSAQVAKSKAHYPPGWGASDQFADPLLVSLKADEKAALDPSLSDKSPARAAGLPLPADWADSLRPKGGAKPDLGAVPAGMRMWPVGVPAR